MKKSTKAVLLSALVFPGTGHLFLKKYFPGSILAGSALIALYYLVTQIIEKALQITEKIESGEVPLDVAVISELVSKSSVSSEGQLLNMATVVLVISWLIGIVDSYRVGRMQDKES